MRVVSQITSETEIQSQIKQYLEVLGHTVYRINNGAVWNRARQCYVFHGTPGVSDLLAMKEGKPAIFIECKKTGGKPSAAQVEFLRLVNASVGVRGVCVDSLEKVMSFEKEGVVKGEKGIG